MPHKKCTLPIKITPAHIDVRNHVNNLVYLQWCVDAAEMHWEQNTPAALRSKYVWYVVNHNIDYKASAFLNEELEVSTWVATAKGVRSERHYKIVRPSDGKTLVAAKTIWCLLDATTLRPSQITDEIRNLFL